MLDLSRRWGAGLYIVTEDEGATVGIREGGNVKKCRPVVKEPSGGTLLFRCALPARGASVRPALFGDQRQLCLGAACTGCIQKASAPPTKSRALPRRCLHEVHRQKPTNCGTPFCSIRRESVDSFSEINNKDSCADYFPALFCCQGDLHHHYRQPRTDNRPVLRCEQHRLFLFILSSHYRRLL